MAGVGSQEGLPRSCAPDDTEKVATGHSVMRTGRTIPSISLGMNTVPVPALSTTAVPAAPENTSVNDRARVSGGESGLSPAR